MGREQTSRPDRTETVPIRVRVLLGFWVTAVLPGLVVPPGMAGTFGRIVLWGAIFFASILAHELAHAAVGLCFGHRAVIVLRSTGGLTQFEPALSKNRALLALLAGPVASLALGSLLAALRRTNPAPALSFAMWVNTVWGTINLLPILPLDGGRAMVESFDDKEKATAVSFSAALAFGAVSLGLSELRSAGVFTFFLGGSVFSVLEWTKLRRQAVRVRVLKRLAEARLLLQRGTCMEARIMADGIALGAPDLECRNAALTTVVWAWLGEGVPRRAREAMSQIEPPNAVDDYTRAAVDNASGQPDLAITTLERLCQETTPSREAARLLVDLHAQAGDLSKVAHYARNLATVLGPDDVRLVARALETAGEPGCAADLRTIA